jgi:hypothetical protein
VSILETRNNALANRNEVSVEALRILLIAANPLGDLKLDEEVRSIEVGIQESAYRECVSVIPALAARSEDLIGRLSRHHPQVVHFSGHGIAAKGSGSDAATGSGNRDFVATDPETEAQIVLVDDSTGVPKPVGQQALADLFRVRRGEIRLVLLNACFTRPLAEAISEVVDCVIGTNRAIGDVAARVFSRRFYCTVADGGSIQQAFDDAKVELELHGIPESATPVLVSRRGVNAADVVLLVPKGATDPRGRPASVAPAAWPAPLWDWARQHEPALILGSIVTALSLLVAATLWSTRKPDPISRDDPSRSVNRTLPEKALARLGTRVEEVQQGIRRVFSFGPYTYLSAQLDELQRRIHAGVDSEESLERDASALSARTDLMLALQSLEHEATGLSDSEASVELLTLVKQARTDLINDNIEAADEVRDQIEEKLAKGHRSSPRPAAHQAEHEWPRILQSEEDPRSAIPWLWENESVIRIAFLDGAEERRVKVMHAAQEWTKYANLTFQLVDDPQLADVRVAMEPPLASVGNFYSMLGKQARSIPKDRPTTILGFEPVTNDVQVRRKTLWIFGHVLGLLNEHMNPNCRDVVRFKPESAVIAFFRKTYGWDANTTRHTIFGAGLPEQLSAYRACDPYSIMMLQLPREIVEPTPPEIDDLSEGDKAFAKQLYPGREGLSARSRHPNSALVKVAWVSLSLAPEPARRFSLFVTPSALSSRATVCSQKLAPVNGLRGPSSIDLP